MVDGYFALSGSNYNKEFHPFVLLGELAKSEFGKRVHWAGQRVHFDQITSTKALKDKAKVELFSTPEFAC